jgi:hypothetical protein
MNLGDRVRAGAASRASRTPAPRTPAGATTPPSTRARIEGLEPRERLFSFAGAGLAVVVGLIIYLVETNDRHFRVGKGQLTPQTTLVLSLVFGALLGVATLFGRRAPIGFVSLFAFLGFGLPWGLPFLVLAVWLLYRSYRLQKEATALAKAARSSQAAQTSTVPRSTSPATPGSKRPPVGQGPRRSARAKTSNAPEPNKRYTPKRLPPPAPKPSRRDRKAAKTTE